MACLKYSEAPFHGGEGWKKNDHYPSYLLANNHPLWQNCPGCVFIQIVNTAVKVMQSLGIDEHLQDAVYTCTEEEFLTFSIILFLHSNILFT
jgi:hypothetical protein